MMKITKSGTFGISRHILEKLYITRETILSVFHCFLFHKNSCILLKLLHYYRDIFSRLGNQYTSLGTQTFYVFFLQLYFNKKYVEVAINYFTMHLIILKWLKKQKFRQKRKTMRPKKVKVKKITVCQSVLFI